MRNEIECVRIAYVDLYIPHRTFTYEYISFFLRLRTCAPTYPNTLFILHGAGYTLEGCPAGGKEVPILGGLMHDVGGTGAGVLTAAGASQSEGGVGVSGVLLLVTTLALKGARYYSNGIILLADGGGTTNSTIT